MGLCEVIMGPRDAMQAKAQLCRAIGGCMTFAARLARLCRVPVFALTLPNESSVTPSRWR